MLKSNGGPFDVGVVVDLGHVTPEGVAPEVEDHRFSQRQARFIEQMDSTEFWGLLAQVSEGRLRSIFGPELKRQGGGAATDEGCGEASLGCLVPFKAPQILVDDWGRLRMNVEDAEFQPFNLSVTDVRFYGDDLATVDHSIVHRVQRRIDGGVPLLLSVGLTRPWQKPGDSVRRHWLQVNNLHFEDSPIGDVV